MKKFTALMLVILMVVSLLPFGVSAAEVTEVDTVAEFAAMKDGNYKLTADIDLSKATFTTIPEFSGTLDGNGKTITVPTDTTIIDKLTGTIKNVNYKGTMTLDKDDASKFTEFNNMNGGGIGVVANYMWGGHVDTVAIDVNITFTCDNNTRINIGGVAGNMAPDYKDANKDAQTVTIVEGSTIKNVTVKGTWALNYNKDSRQSSAIGGIVGLINSDCVVSNTASFAKVTLTDNANGQYGGFAGSAYSDAYGFNAKAETAINPPKFENCLYAGEWTIKGGRDQTGAMVGYSRGLTLKNCFSAGTWTLTNANDSNDSVAQVVGYNNVNKDIPGCLITVDGCASVTNVVVGDRQAKRFARLRNTGASVKNCIIMEGYEIAKDGAVTDAQIADNTTLADAAAVSAKFVELNAANFKLEGGAVVAKIAAPATTPVAKPTGDMTVALVAVSLVSLAAVTVISKKKISK